MQAILARDPFEVVVDAAEASAVRFTSRGRHAYCCFHDVGYLVQMGVDFVR